MMNTLGFSTFTLPTDLVLPRIVYVIALGADGVSPSQP
jgi:hypothetical protein